MSLHPLTTVAAGGHQGPRRFVRLAALAAGGTLLAAAALVVPVWVFVLLPRWFVRGATVGFLWGTLLLALTAAVAAPAGLIASAVRARRARDARRPWVGAARGLLLCGSCLAGLAVLELGAAAALRRQHRIPNLPTTFPADEAGGAIDLAVIGESSARGEPYQGWLSAGEIIAWKLREVFPGRPVRVEMLAQSGACLEQAVLRLQRLTRRPDAVLIYAGHNEFQTRYGWSRNVGYYGHELPRKPLREVALDGLARGSSLCELIRQTLERQRVDLPPPPDVTREPVDHPSFTPREYAFLRDDFRRRLDGVVAYCRSIGALPILVIPAGNVGDLPPNRSMLAPSATPAQRAAFARAFAAGRAAEGGDPAAAEKAYRALLARQPGFAEAHYRLARLLDRDGRRGEAKPHFLLARDLDGFPMRCPGDFQRAYRDVAAGSDVVLVDGPAVLGRLSPRGVPDDSVLHDGQHPNLRGYAALAQEALDRLRARRAFGWPADAPRPVVAAAECAAHFRMDAARWAEVCARAASYHERTAYIRYDPSESLAKGRAYRDAARRLAAGASLAEAGLPGLDF